jgi:large subunit ribosomal protein L17
MRRNLVQSLFEHGKVRTTLPKAKEVRAMAEKLITVARLGTLTARRKAISILNDRRLVDEEQEFTGQTVIQKLFDEVAPQFSDRPGGYTRIIKLSDFRIGDGGSLVILQLVGQEPEVKATARRSAGLRRRRAERKHQFASAAMKKHKKGDAGDSAAEPAPNEKPQA